MDNFTPQQNNDNPKNILVTVLSITTIILLLLSLVGGYMYYQQISELRELKSEVEELKGEKVELEDENKKLVDDNQKIIGEDNENNEIKQDYSVTSDWKTYEDEEYGFSIKYPINFTVEKNSYSVKFFSSDDMKFKDIPHNPHFMSIHIEKLEDGETLESWAKKELDIKEFKEFSEDPSAENNYVDLIIKIGRKNNDIYKIHRWIQANNEWNYIFKNQDSVIRVSRLNQYFRDDKYPFYEQDLTFELMMMTFLDNYIDTSF